MAFCAPLAAVLLLLSSFTLATSDNIIVRNSFKGLDTLTIDCNWGLDAEGTFVAPYGGNTTLMAYEGALCSASLGVRVDLIVYSHMEDHARCKTRCVLDVKNNGLYAWNPKGKVWQFIRAFTHY